MKIEKYIARMLRPFPFSAAAPSDLLHILINIYL